MNRWIVASILGVVFHLVSWPILGILALGSALSSFTHDSGKPTKYWEAEGPDAFERVWFGGYYVSAWIFDHVVFGGAMPPAPYHPDFSEPGAEEKLKRMADAYYPEYQRRKWAYNLCWVFNELAFGMALGGMYVLMRPAKDGKPNAKLAERVSSEHQNIL